MRRAFLAALLVSAGLSSTEALAEDPGFVGNTIVSVTESLGAIDFAMSPDGTFTGSDGSAGNWTYDGTTLCFLQAGQDPFCGNFDGSKGVGDSWEGPDWSLPDKKAKLSIKAGT